MNATIREFFDRELGDAKVQSISWINDDLLLDLALPGPPERNLSLRFALISRLRIDFDYGDYVGQPLLFSVEAQQTENSGWKVRFEFGAAPDGKIEFECKEISGVAEGNRI